MEAFSETLKTWYVHPSGAVSGIPCVHAQAAIMYTQQDPMSYISSWFSKEKYMLTYGCNILPINGSNMWVKSPYPKPLPPIERRIPGRLVIKRKRHRRGGRGGRCGRGGGRGGRCEMGESINGPQFEVKTEYEVKPDVEVKPEYEVKPDIEVEPDVVDERDGIDISNINTIVSSIINLRSSNYSDAEIMYTLGINESQSVTPAFPG
uniref:Uncharacterized protein n=1 Tax=Lactuca sativa TaxID=4236 RepID=A0A9R1X2G4_LACSA|nr:hypothetical protein LSAT_V11C700353890 [Lactuca sativa]